jgi:hypothetical protein
MRMRLLVEPCQGGGCPAVYETDRGTVVVQGARLARSDRPDGVPAHEEIVEIPAELLRLAAARLGEPPA